MVDRTKWVGGAVLVVLVALAGFQGLKIGGQATGGDDPGGCGGEPGLDLEATDPTTAAAAVTSATTASALVASTAPGVEIMRRGDYAITLHPPPGQSWTARGAAQVTRGLLTLQRTHVVTGVTTPIARLGSAGTRVSLSMNPFVLEVRVSAAGLMIPEFAFLDADTRAHVQTGIESVVGALSDLPVQIIAKATGAIIKQTVDPNAPVDDGTEYLYFNLSTTAYESPPATPPLQGLVVILDPDDPMFFIRVATPLAAGYAKSVVKKVGYVELSALGASWRGNLHLATNEAMWSGDNNVAHSEVSGHVYFEGMYNCFYEPTNNYTLRFDGSGIVELPLLQGGGQPPLQALFERNLTGLASAHLLGRGSLHVGLAPGWLGVTGAFVVSALTDFTLAGGEIEAFWEGTNIDLRAYAAALPQPLNKFGLNQIPELQPYLAYSGGRADFYFRDFTHLGARLSLVSTGQSAIATVRAERKGTTFDLCYGVLNQEQCVTGCASEDVCPAGKICYFGFCSNPRPIDGACGEDVDCASGHCAIDLLQPVCKECTRDEHCPSGRICDNSGLFCKAKLNNGLVCSLDRECASGHCKNLVCRQCGHDSHCPRTQVCDNTGWFCKNKFANGTTCSLDRECSSGHCKNLVCRQCGHDSHCSSTQVCDNTGWFCKNKFSSGTACSADRECVSGLCQALRCGECTSDSGCPSSEFCSDDATRMCKAKKARRGTCNRDRQCASNNCASGLCGL